MTQVQGKLTYPDGTPAANRSVLFSLVGAERAFVSADDETVIGRQPTVTTDAVGAYTIDLPGNSAMNPVDTRWRREIVTDAGQPNLIDDLVVPATAGPYFEEEILASAPDAIPTATPSNELDVASRTTNQAGMVLNGFNLITIADMVVTVPDIDRPVWILCQLWVESNTANVNIDAAIAPPGSNTIGQQVAAAAGFVGAIGKECSPMAWARLPAHSPGDYQAAVTGDAGTVSLIAGAEHRIAVLAV